MAVLIEAERLTKQFGSLKAVDGISLSVPAGEVLGFLGPNGAGKSTTMKMISGFLEPDSGRAAISGYDVHQEPLRARRHLGYLPEGAPAYSEMTPRGYLRFIAEVRGFRGSDIGRHVDHAVALTSLAEVLDQPIETLSKGFKRRVGIAQAILHDPSVLIMDEPTDGLDPNQKHQVRELIREMSAHKAIIVSTHILEEVEAVCSRAVVIARGRIVANGTAEELMRRSPTHGAVGIKVASRDADEVRRTLEAFQTIAKVETLSQANGHIQLRALPKNGAVIPDGITKALREKNIDVDELFVERGRLDDVFREITDESESMSGKKRGRHA